MLGATPWLDRVREAFRLEAVEIGERPLAERPRSRKLQWSHSTCISGQEKKQQQQQQQQWRLASRDSRLALWLPLLDACCRNLRPY
ncbi:hypothetical protein E4U40_007156 [Claviceps sp. LM458 group G5]|nr:hypothetical protein E4U40_007156 [Claviceps sp. LM458 group G5]